MDFGLVEFLAGVVILVLYIAWIRAFVRWDRQVEAFWRQSRRKPSAPARPRVINIGRRPC